MEIEEDKASGTREFSSLSGSGMQSGDPELQVRYLNLSRLESGTVVNGRYRLEKLTGKGGFGTVFAARDLTLKASMALKFFDPASLQDEKKFLRVQREINLSRRISDPRIVRIYSLENWSGIWFTVMEQVDSVTLKELLKTKGRFSWAEFRPVFLEILRGVESLHGQGIIHRDLKPSNIMVDAAGRVKILDFGLAKEIGDLEKTSSVGEIVGSPFYLSPEQIQGAELGIESDIYQLGILLFQALTGAYPFSDTSTVALVMMHLNAAPDRIAARGIKVPPVVEFAVAKALAKKKQERFRSAGAMAERLRLGKVPAGHAVAARIPRALRWLAACVTGLALLGAAFLLTYGSSRLHAVAAEGTAVRAENRFGRTLWIRDFSPFTVHLAHLVRTPGHWHRYPQQNPIEKLNDSFTQRLQNTPAPVVLAFLSHPGKGVFARDGSVNSDRFDNQLAVVNASGRLLDKESYSGAFGLNAYDFAPVFCNGAFRESGKEEEKLSLFYLQNFQGMYPAALLAANGTCVAVLCSPGGIIDARVLHNDAQGGSLLVLGANNLLSHMAYLTEWTFSPLAKNRLDMFPSYFQDPGLTAREFVVVVPSNCQIVEERWRAEGWASLAESNERKTIKVYRDGRLVLDRGGRATAYRDDPALLAQAYGLINECFQQKTARRNPEKALELSATAARLPVRNPYLRSALLNLKGDCAIALGRYSEGKKDLQEALRHFPGNNDAIKRLLETAYIEAGPLAAVDMLERSFSQSRNLSGLSDVGYYLFLGYAHLAAGQEEKAGEYFEKIFQGQFPDSREVLLGIRDLFGGHHDRALELLSRAEEKVPGFFDIRELRLLLARSMILAGKNPARARWILQDLAKFSLRQGHMAEISLCYLLAREGKRSEARDRIGPAFARLRGTAAGDFETRLWFWYDAFVYARTMEILGDRQEARAGYRACMQANPHTALAVEARRALAGLK